MRTLKYFFTLSCIVLLYSCKGEIKQIEETVSVSPKIEKIEVIIQGMTCEIGCAKLIESKTHKLEGMTFAKVSFEHGLGQFTFDRNKISIQDIEKYINGIAGGELYKVISSKVVEEFTKFEKTK